jgi:predicted NBD/HSP70 family sugar kinase
VADAAVHGDPVGVELLSSTGRYVGQALATLINCFNPSLVVLGGRVTESGEHLLPALRSAVYARSLPLATRDLRITTSQLGAAGGLIGAAFMVVDELLSEALLPRWLDAGSPAGQPQLALPRATA